MLTWEDLRLTSQEARQVARLRAGKRGSRETIRAVCNAADGWAAGLVLLLEQLRTGSLGKGAGRAPRSEAIFDYFAREVFMRTDPQIRGVSCRPPSCRG
jgi:ATP/maltotriose-dependent transcriptional regulator MalT